MYERLVELLYLYEIQNKFYDELFVEEVVNILNEEYNLKDMVTNIDFNSKELFNNPAMYIPSKKKIDISLKRRKDLDVMLSVLYKTIYDNTSKTLVHNIFLINTLLHEFDHVLLEKECINGENDIMHKLFKLCNFSQIIDDLEKERISLLKGTFRIFKEKYIYEKNHDYVPYEIRAIISSYRNTEKLVSEIYNTDLNLLDIQFNDLVITMLSSFETLRRYKNKGSVVLNSPSYDYCNKFKHYKDRYPEELELYNRSRIESFLTDSANYSFDERILNGLQISNSEYIEYYNQSILKQQENRTKVLKMLLK